MAEAFSALSLKAKLQTLPESVRTEMAALKPVLLPQVTPILKSVFESLPNIDSTTLSARVATEARLFGHILTAHFDDAFVDELIAINLERYRAKVPMEAVFYLSNEVSVRLQKEVVLHYRRKPERIIAGLEALNRCLLLSSEIAIAVHIGSAQKDTAEASESRLKEFETRIGEVVGTLTNSGSTLRLAAQTMAGSADETNKEAATVAAAATQASGNVQMVASAAEELSSAISEISRQVGQSSQIAHKAADEARKTDLTIAGLSSAAAKIGEIVKLIATIAGQTNLLALNATIEAARAGEAGKGFAVVASEVKNLATQTARATEDITSQVTAIQGATKDTVAVMRDIGATITEINDISTTIAAAVEQQGSATAEIARNVQEAASGTLAVTRTIEQVTRSAAETGEAAGNVLGTAEDLNTQSQRLQAAIGDFIKTLRVA